MRVYFKGVEIDQIPELNNSAEDSTGLQPR